jgi:hypothetical protein
MPTILADVNIQGQVRHLVAAMQVEPWREFWTGLSMRFVTFADVGLSPDSPDSEVWRFCQQNQLVLITGNRNADGADSLQSTIQTENTTECLPVLTVSDAQALQRGRDYAAAVIESILDVMMRLEDLRGTGRLFLPLT